MARATDFVCPPSPLATSIDIKRIAHAHVSSACFILEPSIILLILTNSTCRLAGIYIVLYSCHVVDLLDARQLLLLMAVPSFANLI